MRGKLLSLVFLALVFIPSALLLVLPKRTFSERENRYLAKMPVLSASALKSGAYTSDFEKYVTDAFPFRDAFVTAKTLSERAVGKRESGGVYFAEDGYLIERFDSIDEENFEKNLAYAAEFCHRAAQRGIKSEVILVPTAAYVLEDKLPPFAPSVNQRELLATAAARLPLCDVAEALSARSDEYIYYRTDHHWTSLGAYYAYRAWRGEAARPLCAFQKEILSDEFYGTAYSRAGTPFSRPDTITAYYSAASAPVRYNLGAETAETIYAREFLEKKDKYSVFLNGNQSESAISGSGANGRRLLVIKDSYANTFVQFLTEDFDEIDVLDLRYFKAPLSQYVSEKKITDVLILYNLKGFAESTELSLLAR